MPIKEITKGLVKKLLDAYGKIGSLDLSQHEIKVVENLDPMCSFLRVLKLNENSIYKLKGLQKCKVLEVLLLNDNNIKDFDPYGLPTSIVELDLSDNPIANDHSKLLRAICRLENLKKLNGKSLGRDERRQMERLRKELDGKGKRKDKEKDKERKVKEKEEEIDQSPLSDQQDIKTAATGDEIDVHKGIEEKMAELESTLSRATERFELALAKEGQAGKDNENGEKSDENNLGDVIDTKANAEDDNALTGAQREYIKAKEAYEAAKAETEAQVQALGLLSNTHAQALDESMAIPPSSVRFQLPPPLTPVQSNPLRASMAGSLPRGGGGGFGYGGLGDTMMSTMDTRANPLRQSMPLNATNPNIGMSMSGTSALDRVLAEGRALQSMNGMNMNMNTLNRGVSETDYQHRISELEDALAVSRKRQPTLPTQVAPMPVPMPVPMAMPMPTPMNAPTSVVNPMGPVVSAVPATATTVSTAGRGGGGGGGDGGGGGGGGMDGGDLTMRTLVGKITELENAMGASVRHIDERDDNDNADDSSSSLHDKISQLERALADLEGENAALMETLKAKEEDAPESDTEELQTMKLELEEYKQYKERAEAAEGELNRLNELAGGDGDGDGEMGDLGSTLHTLRGQVDILQLENDGLAHARDKLEEVALLHRVFASWRSLLLKGKTEKVECDKEEKLTAAEREIEVLKSRVSELEGQLATAEAQIREHEAVRSELEFAKAELEKEREERSGLGSAMDTLRQQLSATLNERDEAYSRSEGIRVMKRHFLAWRALSAKSSAVRAAEKAEKEKREMESAAIKIQKRYRGLHARRTVSSRRAAVEAEQRKKQEEKEMEQATLRIQKVFRGKKARTEYGRKKQIAMIQAQKREEEQAALRIQTIFRGRKAKTALQSKRNSRDERRILKRCLRAWHRVVAAEAAAREKERVDAAVKIQTRFRIKRARGEFEHKKTQKLTIAELTGLRNEVPKLKDKIAKLIAEKAMIENTTKVQVEEATQQAEQAEDAVKMAREALEKEKANSKLLRAYFGVPDTHPDSAARAVTEGTAAALINAFNDGRYGVTLSDLGSGTDSGSEKSEKEDKDKSGEMDSEAEENEMEILQNEANTLRVKVESLTDILRIQESVFADLRRHGLHRDARAAAAALVKRWRETAFNAVVQSKTSSIVQNEEHRRLLHQLEDARIAANTAEAEVKVMKKQQEISYMEVMEGVEKRLRGVQDTENDLIRGLGLMQTLSARLEFMFSRVGALKDLWKAKEAKWQGKLSLSQSQLQQSQSQTAQTNVPATPAGRAAMMAMMMSQSVPPNTSTSTSARRPMSMSYTATAAGHAAIVAELDRVTLERDRLAAEAGNEVELREQQIEAARREGLALAEEYKQESQKLRDELYVLKAEFSQVKEDLETAEKTVSEMNKKRNDYHAEIEAMREESKKERERLLQESALREEQLLSQVNDARRENSALSVASKQSERDLERMKERLLHEENRKKEQLEAKLAAAQAAQRTARSERNAVLAVLRQHEAVCPQHQHQHQQHHSDSLLSSLPGSVHMPLPLSTDDHNLVGRAEKSSELFGSDSGGSGGYSDQLDALASITQRLLKG